MLTTLPMPDAEVLFYSAFFPVDAADATFARLRDEIAWTQQTIGTPAGRVPLPRLTAWYGDEGTTYRYSGIVQHPLAWTPLLTAIKTRVETAAETTFNSVLLNYYRDGRDSVSWHSDDEPELGQNPVIASVTFGAARQFQFKHKTQPQMRTTVELTHGSLLLMRGATQHHWLHRIPKTTQSLDGRINLTFRQITPTSGQ